VIIYAPRAPSTSRRGRWRPSRPSSAGR
jgi:hypothetical protein